MGRESPNHPTDVCTGLWDECSSCQFHSQVGPLSHPLKETYYRPLEFDGGGHGGA